MVNVLWDRSSEEELAKYKRPYTHGGKKIAKPISKIDDFAKHVNREDHQEADHWANIGAQGQRKTILDRCDDSKWKAVKGYWDSSFKDHGESGCGVVMKGVNRNKWLTISQNIRFPLSFLFFLVSLRFLQ